MHEVFNPLGVNISLPSLRINQQLRSLPKLVQGVRRGGLTLAPEVARDDMREQIRKKIRNEDLYEGCREAFKNGWRRVKLYFMCGLPGERVVDLDGIIDMAETIARIGKETIGRFVDVNASVSNFVPKPHTPYQWNGMQTRRVSALGRSISARPAADPVGESVAARYRNEPLGRRAHPRRPSDCPSARRSLAARLPARWMERMLPARDLVEDFR